MSFAGMLNRLGGQPDSYDKKAKYRFGRTLGAGTYGVVREAEGPTGKVAVKIILKKNVKGNEKMVYDELKMLQTLKHPHIVKFVDWFESRDKFYIVTQLATGGELFDRICEQGKFTEKDAAETIRQVLTAVDYLHKNEIVHRDLKPENLLYVTAEPDSEIVLADFGIAKNLDNKEESLQTMAGSFGYAAPEVMDRKGHGKPVDMWSMGVITYTLLCGYSPFRSENLRELLDECTFGSLVFHDRYWRDVSQEAKDFIQRLIVPDPSKRYTSEKALADVWLTGQAATDHNLAPDFRSNIIQSRAKLQHAILAISLKKRIERLRAEESDGESDEMGDAEEQIPGLAPASSADKKNNLLRDKVKDGSVFREVVLGAVRDQKAKEEAAAEQKQLEETQRQRQA